MALIRPIRLQPVKPTREALLALMASHALRRKTVARLMRCSPPAVASYVRGSRPIPLARFELLLLKLQSIYRADEPIELPL